MLLDEPLAALDAQLRHAVQLELKQLQQRLGITFIFVTHDQDEAMLLSDRLAVMSAGTILQTGSPREVYEQPQELSVATFIGQTNQMTVQSLRQCSRRLAEYVSERFSDAVTLIIRPQAIRPSSETDADFLATVTQQIFRGETVQHLLRLPTGQTLTASGWTDSPHLATGAAVHCQVDRERLLCFDSAGGSCHFRL